jgi:glutamate synthase (NADPH/NADH) small chain
MGKPTGFMEFPRKAPPKRPVSERVKDFRDLYLPLPQESLKEQAARCMDCGVPTCIAGCPLGNRIPDWNDLVCKGRWRDAFDQLAATNNFPEFTGRLCPAPCEEACVLGINADPVTIEQIEKSIVEHAFAQGWVVPEPPPQRTGKQVAVVGSGPAGLACAQQLNRAGHRVTVFERAARIGGLLRYGIPDFKLEKAVIDRRLQVLEAEGIQFRAGINVSRDQLAHFDAVVLCTGSTRPRDLPIPGRELDGIHFAMDFLSRQNLEIGKETLAGEPISAEGKQVVVIGGGDTGSDCIGTCHRQAARAVVNFEFTPQPPENRPTRQPWPYWPMRLRTSTSHEEGGQREWNILTKRFSGRHGRVEKIVTVDVEFVANAHGETDVHERPDSQREWPADLVLLAIGFQGPEFGAMMADYGIIPDAKGSIPTDDRFMTPVPGVFAAGDARRGQSLIVWAISEGREAARAVDTYLMGNSELPGKGCCDLPRVS